MYISLHVVLFCVTEPTMLLLLLLLFLQLYTLE
jgi:hypothetical protein